jgi:hypothetical protein
MRHLVSFFVVEPLGQLIRQEIVPTSPAGQRYADRWRGVSWLLRPSSDRLCGKRRLGFDQALMFKLGQEFRRDLAKGAACVAMGA